MIAYHGTNKEAARSIIREGFRPETYFAYDKYAAIIYGGPYVFAVKFCDDPAMWHGEEDGWQFHTDIHLPTTTIIGFTKAGKVEEKPMNDPTDDV